VATTRKVITRTVLNVRGFGAGLLGRFGAHTLLVLPETTTGAAAGCTPELIARPSQGQRRDSHRPKIAIGYAGVETS
jgi:hypothetical protein